MPRMQTALGSINFTASVRRDGICLSFQYLGVGGREVKSSRSSSASVLSTDSRITRETGLCVCL